jgi:hypothetical protein
MKIVTEIPTLAADIFREDPMAGRQILMNAGYSEYDAKYYSRLFKDADVRYGIDEATEKAIIWPDIHFPRHNRKCLDVVAEFAEDYQPDYMIYLGDQLEMDTLSSWRRKKFIPAKGSIKEDCDGFNAEVLKVHEDICPNARRVWFDGNHEQRATN